MKNFFKWFGIIAFVAVIGFSMVACDFGGNDNSNGNGNGENGGNGNGGNGGGGATNPTITIRNNTGYTLSYSYIKPSTSTNWGSDIGPTWQDGESKTGTLSQHLSTQSVYDIRLRQNSSSGFMFTKYNVSATEGMIVTFTTSDLEQ
jgi:hypothetical protein